MGIISEFMNDDHSYIDELWAKVLNEKSDLDLLSEYLRNFKEHLLLHMKLEDDYLFPRLNSYLGIDINSGLTAMAKRDHLIILKLLTFTEEAEKARDIKKAILTGRHLDRALKKHREREQMIQYPVSDVFIERDEWEIMLIKIYGKKLEY